MPRPTLLLAACLLLPPVARAQTPPRWVVVTRSGPLIRELDTTTIARDSAVTLAWVRTRFTDSDSSATDRYAYDCRARQFAITAFVIHDRTGATVAAADLPTADWHTIPPESRVEADLVYVCNPFDTLPRSP